jgi:hypothetical protein
MRITSASRIQLWSTLDVGDYRASSFWLLLNAAPSRSASHVVDFFNAFPLPGRTAGNPARTSTNIPKDICQPLLPLDIWYWICL